MAKEDHLELVGIRIRGCCCALTGTQNTAKPEEDPTTSSQWTKSPCRSCRDSCWRIEWMSNAAENNSSASSCREQYQPAVRVVALTKAGTILSFIVCAGGNIYESVSDGISHLPFPLQRPRLSLLLAHQSIRKDIKGASNPPNRLPDKKHNQSINQPSYIASTNHSTTMSPATVAQNSTIAKGTSPSWSPYPERNEMIS